MELKLNTLQKLNLYQIIAFAEEGNTEKVIERANAMLKSAGESPVTLTETQRESLVTLSVQDILSAALKNAA